MHMVIVDCREEYWEFVRKLRNNPEVTDGFIEKTYITPEMQQRYMQRYSKHYLIALIENEPAGYAGVIEDDIRVCVHPDYQKRGVGKLLITEIMRAYPNAYAKVKVTNEQRNNVTQ